MKKAAQAFCSTETAFVRSCTTKITPAACSPRVICSSLIFVRVRIPRRNVPVRRRSSLPTVTRVLFQVETKVERNGDRRVASSRQCVRRQSARVRLFAERSLSELRRSRTFTSTNRQSCITFHSERSGTRPTSSLVSCRLRFLCQRRFLPSNQFASQLRNRSEFEDRSGEFRQ